jgi:fructose-specific phosphotransferase system IIA component
LNPSVQTVVLLTDLLPAVRVRVPLRATNKDEILDELVDVLVEGRCVDDHDEVLRVVREREAVLSTGIGNGVALPHGKSAACSDLFLAAGVTAEPVDFDALDGRPVRLVFMLVGPESVAGAHIKALSQISRLVRRPEVRQRLVEAEDGEAFLAVLREAEGG